MTFHPGDLNQFVFGQQHYGTKDFFLRETGSYHTVPLDRFPHYIFLRDHLNEPFSDHLYMRYISAERGFKDALAGKNTPEIRKAKIKSFMALYNSVAERVRLNRKPFFDKPVRAYTRPDGKHVIIQGNHRAAVAMKLGIDLPVRFIKAKKALFETSVTRVSTEMYGTTYASTPAISVFEGEKEIVKGRHRDTLDIMKALDSGDIKGQTILDLGCNIGSRCFLAAALGAKGAIGIDNHSGVISSAIRLNSYFAAPADFIVHDLNHKLNDIDPADTVFCFSVANKIMDRTVFIQTLLKKTRNVLYIGFQSDNILKSYRDLLNDRNFSSIEKIPAKGISGRGREEHAILRCLISKEVRLSQEAEDAVSRL